MQQTSRSIRNSSQCLSLPLQTNTPLSGTAVVVGGDGGLLSGLSPSLSSSPYGMIFDMESILPLSQLSSDSGG